MTHGTGVASAFAKRFGGPGAGDTEPVLGQWHSYSGSIDQNDRSIQLWSGTLAPLTPPGVSVLIRLREASPGP